MVDETTKLITLYGNLQFSFMLKTYQNKVSMLVSAPYSL